MDKRFWAIVGVIVIVFSGVVLYNNHNKKAATKAADGGATTHVIGDLQSKVTVLEYGDYECPACGEFFPTTHAVQQKYIDKVKFQFRNLPLASIHPNAFAGARAAEAADMQGKFWQMHDLLYQNQDASGQSGWVASSDALNQYFVSFAQQLGLNVSKFKTDFASTTANNRINADTDAFKATGQPMATPTFFINGKKVDNNALLDSKGQPSVDAFSKQIDAALAQAK